MAGPADRLDVTTNQEGAKRMEQPALAEQLDPYRNRFPGLHLEMVLASIVAGNTGGHLWEIPQPDALPLLLLWDKGNNVFYLAGDCRAQSALSSLAEVVALELRPQALAEGAPTFKVRTLTPSEEDGLSQIFPGIALRASPTLFSVFDASRLGSQSGERPPGTPQGSAWVSVTLPALPEAVFIPITPAVLTSGTFAYSDNVRSEIRSMWPSEERFYQYGFGTVAVLHGEIICWCTAEYVSPTQCGIGIETAPRFEGRGVATATATYFVQQARERGVTPYWECSLNNQGSVRVAEKVGFVRLAEETYWIGSFAP